MTCAVAESDPSCPVHALTAASGGGLLPSRTGSNPNPGGTDAHDNRQRFGEQADGAAALLDLLGLSPAAVFGTSLGGLIAVLRESAIPVCLIVSDNSHAYFAQGRSPALVDGVRQAVNRYARDAVGVG